MIQKLSSQTPSFFAYIAYILLFVLWSFVEPVRLYLGYFGNLQELVPNFTAAILCTIFVQFPLSIYFIGFQPFMKPLEHIISMIFIVFVVLEALFGLLQLKHIVKVSSAKYALMFNPDGTLYEYDEELAAGDIIPVNDQIGFGDENKRSELLGGSSSIQVVNHESAAILTANHATFVKPESTQQGEK